MSPMEIWEQWDYPLFLNAIERINVLNEIERRNHKDI